jgi:Patched family
LALDERRVVLAQAKDMVNQDQKKSERRASLSTKFFSWVSDKSSRLLSKGDQDGDAASVDNNEDKQKSPIFIERLMTWYARALMKPKVRNSIIFFCLALFGVCVYGTTQLRQSFSPQDYVPSDSYIQGFFNNREYCLVSLPQYETTYAS